MPVRQFEVLSLERKPYSYRSVDTAATDYLWDHRITSYITQMVQRPIHVGVDHRPGCTLIQSPFDPPFFAIRRFLDRVPGKSVNL
jgi:hypothetical protein